MKQRRIKFSVQQVTAICDGFVALGDEVFRYADQLLSADFRAFIPRWKFTESFCADQQECELHRQCAVERAKYLVGKPWPPLHLGWTSAERALLYASPLFERLRIERDKENDIPVNELSTKYPLGESSWRREIDPCRRRQLMAESREPLIYRERWSALLEEEARAFDLDVAEQGTDVPRAYDFDKEGRYALFVAVMERDAAPLGFYYDSGKSRSHYPIFSKSISKEWDLCWSIEKAEAFHGNQFEGQFTPSLQVRRHSRAGELGNFGPGEFLHIRYADVVPGFFNAYRTFHRLAQLETVIKAHLCLYHLMAPIIEGTLKGVLG